MNLFPLTSLRLLGVLGGIGILILFSPFVSGSMNLGTVFGCGIGIFCSLFFVFLPLLHTLLKRIAEKEIGRVLLTILFLAALSFLLFTLVLVGMMRRSAGNNDVPDGAVLIVLGCRVEGEEPGKALTQRLERAYQYLCENSNATCILSGGQGDDEEISEAMAMKQYLVAKGIQEYRLITEVQSKNTKENLQNCAKIIKRNRLDKNVAIVTHSYHQCRAAMLAKDVDLVPYAVNAKADFFSYPTYFLRDLLGVAYHVVFK